MDSFFICCMKLCWAKMDCNAHTHTHTHTHISQSTCISLSFLQEFLQKRGDFLSFIFYRSLPFLYGGTWWHICPVHGFIVLNILCSCWLSRNFYASAQHIVARDIMVLSCSSVRPSVRSLMRCLAECLTHFHETYFNDALWDTGECSHSLGVRRSRSQWNNISWKQHFLGLLTRCLEKY